MALSLDGEAQAALDLAKRTIPESDDLQPRHLLAALYHGTAIKDRLPALAAHIPTPQPLAATPGKRRMSESLKTILAPFMGSGAPGSAPEVFAAIATSPTGRNQLTALGVPPTDVDAIATTLGVAPRSPAPTPGEAGSWRSSAERARVVKELSGYGRMLTAVDLRPANLFGVDETIRNIMGGLTQRKQHSVVLVGPPGVGKTVVVQEFARRLATGDPSIIDRLRDNDIFELSPAFLKAGASIVGQFEDRIKGLIETLTKYPKVIVFVDEVHSLLQSEMHTQGPWGGASAEFKKAVGDGSISLIGCTTELEYRHYIEPDRALADRFTKVHVDPPTVEQTIEILHNRMPGLRAYYSELTIPDEIVPIVVHLAEDHLLGRFQPRKSIRLLDQACAWCLVQEPPESEVSELAVRSAIEAETGHKVVDPRAISKRDLLDTLQATIVGQDDLLERLAEAVVQGLRPVVPAKGPRGSFVFAGPTGTGKTETAKLLAKVVSGSGRALIEIDCNTLQGSGWDSQVALNVLFGSPPGYIGYVRGEGGLLSKVRDTPDCVVLFDEIEKADPGVAKTLLQVLQTGMVDDRDGNTLDFRRAFLIFTSNAGVTYGTSPWRGGYERILHEGETRPDVTATATPESVMDDLRRRGFPQEFLGRGIQWFVFHSLDLDAGREILRRLLEAFRAALQERQPPIDLEWDPETIDRLVEAWDAQFGARGLNTLLRDRVKGLLAVAQADNKLDTVTLIRLRTHSPEEAPPDVGPGGSRFDSDGTTATIDLY